MSNAVQLKDAEERQRVLTRLIAETDDAFVDLQPHIRLVQRNRELFNDEQPRTNAPWPGASDVVVHYLKETSRTLLGMIAPAILNQNPRLNFKAFEDERPVEVPLQTFTQEMNTRKLDHRAHVITQIAGGLRDGALITRTTWEQIRRPVRGIEETIEEMIDPDTGLVLASFSRSRRVRTSQFKYNWPRHTAIELQNFTTFPATWADVQWSDGVCAKFPVSAEDLLDKAMQGVFDPEAVRNVLAGDHGGDAEAGSAEDQRRGLGTASEQRYDGTPGRVVLREAWWTYKPLDSDGPAEDWLFIFSADARQLLLAQPAPYKFRPYSVCMPFAPVSGLAGDSLPSSGAGSIQRSLTTFIQLAIDMLTLGIHPYKMVSETLYSRFDKAFKNKRPGDYIKVPDEYFLEGGKGFQTYSPQTNFGAVLEMYSLLSQMGDKYTGANDALKGIPSPDKLTATQATQIMESSQKNAEQILESCAAAVGLTGQHAHELLRLYWQQQEVLELWQRVNPQFPIDACMASEVLVTANGVAAESNKAIRADRAQKIMMMAMNDPTTWSDPAKRYYILTNVSRELGVPYPENFWGTGDDYLQRAQLMAQQQAMAALPAPDGGGYALPA